MVTFLNFIEGLYRKNYKIILEIKCTTHCDFALHSKRHTITRMTLCQNTADLEELGQRAKVVNVLKCLRFIKHDFPVYTGLGVKSDNALSLV